ncbi:uncharacterized protein LOC143527796 [Brachyhypopomus gauderio]|uniref:uncharacterized protein LOC143527796 n=1 Tax=Brachyhypopomus gauderio TaxID=698409 RepID=UPI004041C5A5
MEHLWILFSFVFLAASFDEIIVKLGDPVTLPCREEQEDIYAGKLIWRTSDQIVATYSAGSFEAGTDFRGRVHLSEDGKPRKGIFSLTISSTVYSDFDTYECWYEKKHLKSWTLKITTNLAPTRVSLGGAATLPCYARIKRSALDSDIRVLWMKENEMVLNVIYGFTTDFGNFKGRVSVTPSEIRKGNISLHINETYLSDNGSYTCQIDDKPIHVKLQLTACHNTIQVSLGQALLIPLHTAEDVNVLFRSSQESQNYNVACETSCNTMGWRKRIHDIELKIVREEHVGTYTIEQKRAKFIICTYIISLSENLKKNNVVINNTNSVFTALILCLCLFLCQNLMMYIM